jgi:uncharacterized membrane protein YecN with MAPEG domain
MVTTLYAGILGLLYIALSVYVIKDRFKYGVSLGDAGNDDMVKRIRAHANFIEYVPFALILIILAEFEGTSEVIIHTLCASLVAGRLMHSFGLLNKSVGSIGRRGGMLLTFVVIVASALLCINSFFIF